MVLVFCLGLVVLVMLRLLWCDSRVVFCGWFGGLNCGGSLCFDVQWLCVCWVLASCWGV